MYTKEDWKKGERKSLRGWAYSFGAALFLILMAMAVVAAKSPELGVEECAGKPGGKDVAVKENSAAPKDGDAKFEKTKKNNIKNFALAFGEEIDDKFASTSAEAILFLKKSRANTPLVALDAGHGGIDSGCMGNGAMEKDINLQIALLVREKLREKGFQVMMPRETDEELSKEERVELANSYQADIYISIHQNTYEGRDKSIGGIETWYDGQDGRRDNKSLAEHIHRETLASTGAVERSLIDSGELYVLSNTLMPACLIETGFLSNPAECRKLCGAEYQEKLAEGIVKGIIEYFKEAGKV
ncbi:MAG: N-acetylmuramoyl-L-alanine amidase [Clostridium sp.]|nr:N-acetylmuramoyl-L-alanine amidase [Clostridium sp.]